MSSKEKIGLEVEIDELTNSIRNAITCDSFETNVSRITQSDIKLLSKTKWLFNWKEELSFPERDIYKLTIVNNQKINE